MDPATIIGLVMAVVAIVAMITLEGGHIGAIFLPAPLILVFFGSMLRQFERAAHEALVVGGEPAHSHSIVAGGLPLTS